MHTLIKIAYNKKYTQLWHRKAVYINSYSKSISKLKLLQQSFLHGDYVDLHKARCAAHG